MDYLANTARQDPFNCKLSYALDRIEGFLYCADDYNNGRLKPGEKAWTELSKVSSASSGTRYLVISQRAQGADQAQLSQIEEAINHGRVLEINGRTLGELAALIDTYQAEVWP